MSWSIYERRRWTGPIHGDVIRPLARRVSPPSTSFCPMPRRRCGRRAPQQQYLSTSLCPIPGRRCGRAGLRQDLREQASGARGSSWCRGSPEGRSGTSEGAPLRWRVVWRRSRTYTTAAADAAAAGAGALAARRRSRSAPPGRSTAAAAAAGASRLCALPAGGGAKALQLRGAARSAGATPSHVAKPGLRFPTRRRPRSERRWCRH